MNYYPTCACAARGKAIGSVRLSICLSAQKSPDLEIYGSERLVSATKLSKLSKILLHYALNRLVRPTSVAKLHFYWPRLFTAPLVLFAHVHNVT